MAEANVATPAAEYTAAASYWTLARALLGGTAAMRAAGKTYLPMFKAEDVENYDRRLSTSVLFGGFAKTVKTMAGLPFGKPIALGDDVPGRLKTWAEDIDLCGNHLDVFAKRGFAEGLALGASHILVDMSAEAASTGADDLTRRPQWVHVSPERLIDARTALVDGKQRFVHVRIKETRVERVGYGEKVVQLVREIDCTAAPEWRLWREDKGVWSVAEQGKYDMPYVTLAPFLAGEAAGSFTAKSALENLAYLNVAHWQSASDQRAILTHSRFFILVIKGAAAGDIALGPMTALVLDGTQQHADVKIVEHNGHAIEAGERDLQTLKEEMEAEGLKLLVRRPGTVTATENVIDEAKDQSELEALARSYQDTLELAMEYTAMWVNEPLSGSLELNTDFGIVANAQAIKDTVLELRKLGDLSAEDTLTELQQAGLLSDGLVIDEAVERAAQDAARVIQAMRPANDQDEDNPGAGE